MSAILNLILFGFLLVVLYYSVKKIEIAIIVAVAIKLLVPYYVRFAGVSYFSVINYVIIVSYLCQHLIGYRTIVSRHKHLTNDMLVLGAGLTVCSFFGYDPFTDLLYTIKDNVLNFSLGLIFLFEFNRSKDLESFKNALLITGAFVALYGLYNYIYTSNPYIDYLTILFPDEHFLIYDEERFGMKARVQSTIFHSITFGSYMMLLSLFSLFCYLREGKNIFMVLFFVFFVSSFISASRSVLLSIVAGLLYLFFYLEPRKKLFIVIISSVFLLGFLSRESSLKQYFLSSVFFWDDTYANEADVKGSSMEMRGEQLETVFETVPAQNALFGLGSTYFTAHKIDPKLRKMESAFFRVYVCFGLVGLAVWLNFMVKRLRSNFMFYYFYLNSKSTIILNSLTISFGIFSLATGFMDSIFMFIIVYVLVYKYMHSDKVKSNNTFSQQTF